MKTMSMLDHVHFRDENPIADPLYVDKDGRILLFSLKPGQSIVEHNVPHSPFYVVVLKGAGIFTDGNDSEERLGPNSLLIFDPSENHSVRALDEELVFVGILHGVPTMREDRVGGDLGRT